MYSFKENNQIRAFLGFLLKTWFTRHISAMLNYCGFQ